MLNRLRLMFLNACVYIAAKLTAAAQYIFSASVGLAMKWEAKEGKPTAAVAKVEVAKEEPVPVAEKPSERHRRRRRERANIEAPKAAEAPTEAAKPAPKDRQALAPEVNPFSAGGVDGPVPMCMDPLPTFVIFEAMFNKKYGRNGRCPLNVSGNAHAYTALELYTLLSRIQSDGEKAGPVYNALYGTCVSVILHQHGKQIQAKELN